MNEAKRKFGRGALPRVRLFMWPRSSAALPLRGVPICVMRFVGCLPPEIRSRTGKLLCLAEVNWACYIRYMESPRSVNAFLLAVAGVSLFSSLLFGLYIGSFIGGFWFFLQALGVISLIALGCAVCGILMGVVTSPLVWLLSLFGGSRSKHKH